MEPRAGTLHSTRRHSATWCLERGREAGRGWLSVALRPQKPSGLLGTGAQDGHLDFHTAPGLCIPPVSTAPPGGQNEVGRREPCIPPVRTTPPGGQNEGARREPCIPPVSTAPPGGQNEGHIPISLHCPHQNDSCIKRGSDESHFNVSLIVWDKVARQCPQTTTFEEKGAPKRIRTEIPSAYQPNVLPLGQTGSLMLIAFIL